MLRTALRCHRLGHLTQRSRQGAPVGLRQPSDRADQALLHGNRDAPQHAPALDRQGKTLATPIVAGRCLGDESPPDKPLNHDRDRALMREGQRCKIVDRRARMLRDLLQREKLRAAEAGAAAAAMATRAQRLHDAAERIERRSNVSGSPRA
jgi:hypothetical protein